MLRHLFSQITDLWIFGFVKKTHQWFVCVCVCVRVLEGEEEVGGGACVNHIFLCDMMIKITLVPFCGSWQSKLAWLLVWHSLDHVFWFYKLISNLISSQIHIINSEQKIIDSENSWWNVHVQSYCMSTCLMGSSTVENVSWNNYKPLLKDVLNFRLRALVSTHNDWQWLGS